VELNANRIFENLSDMEQDFIEAEAGARGVTIGTVLHELICEGLELEDMDVDFQTRDSQWKSH
jgi:hypothetical protein